MSTFDSLPLLERQSKVNALLVPATKRLPKRIRRNAKVMGTLVQCVWACFKRDLRLSKAELIRHAHELEAMKPFNHA